LRAPEKVNEDGFFRHGVLIRQDSDGAGLLQIFSITRADSFLKIAWFPEAQR